MLDRQVKTSLEQYAGKLDDHQLASLLREVLDHVTRVENENAELRDRVANLEALRKLTAHDKFISTSEQMEFLFDETEILSCADREEEKGSQKEITVREHKRKVKNVSRMPHDCPVVEIDHTQGAPDEIMEDGVVKVRDGETVITKLSYIPARVVTELHRFPRYVAKNTFSDKKGENVTLLYRNEKVDRLAVSPSLVSHMIVGKYDDHLPLYRQEEMFARQGIVVSRQKMAYWLIKYYDVLQPLEKMMRDAVFRSSFLNLDETNVTVLNVRTAEGKVSRNSFVYLAIGSTWDSSGRTSHTLAYCEYHQGKTTSDILANLKRYDFNGYYLTDGLLQYYHYRNPHKHASCWVHAVRGFKDVLKVDKENKVASFICSKAAMLYRIDEEWRDLLKRGLITEAEFIEERKWRSLICIAYILGTVDDKRTEYSPGSMMGKAFKYIKDYEEYLTVYLDCIEARPSNNAVERMAKAFATGRKNWLFSQSVDGVDASCFFFSLIESAKLQGLNPADYIEYVCTFGPYCRNEGEWKNMLPWNADLNRLDDMRARRVKAKPDPFRREPYILSGAVI